MRRIEKEFEEFLSVTIHGGPLPPETRRQFLMCFLAGGAATLGILNEKEGFVRHSASLLGQELKQVSTDLRNSAPSRIVPIT